MQTNEELIPRPPVVRERLARSLRETRLLKRLLRLSVEAAQEKQPPSAPLPEAARPGGRPMSKRQRPRPEAGGAVGESRHDHPTAPCPRPKTRGPRPGAHSRPPGLGLDDVAALVG